MASTSLKNLTPEEILRLVTTPIKMPSDKRFLDLIMNGETARFVRYDAKLDRVVYEDPENFYWTEASPSDCRMMLPADKD